MILFTEDAPLKDQASLASFCEMQVVSDQDQGGALLFVHVKQEVADQTGIFGVKAGCWFIGKKHFRVYCKGPGYTDSLLFSS